jgi:hypothetical protein
MHAQIFLCYLCCFPSICHCSRLTHWLFLLPYGRADIRSSQMKRYAWIGLPQSIEYFYMTVMWSVSPLGCVSENSEGNFTKFGKQSGHKPWLISLSSNTSCEACMECLVVCAVAETCWRWPYTFYFSLTYVKSSWRYKNFHSVKWNFM